MPTSNAGLLNQHIPLLKSGFAWFGLAATIVASASVLANDGYFLSQGVLTINTIFLAVGALLALSTGRSLRRGLATIVFLLPLCAGMAQQINGYFGVNILVLPNAGLDLVAGFFLAYVSQLLARRQSRLRDFALPWPISLVLLVITFSTALAIIRNIRQSATETSIIGLLFNLTHFRPIGWHDDYMPIADWVAYGAAGALIISVLTILRGAENPNRLIFRPLVAGLFLAFLMGLLQSATGLGLPSSQLEFRKDGLGFAAIGFQPDIHAFAGHMLLGALGLWAYFQTCHAKLERLILLMVMSFSWMGLLISKSRASLLIAICASLAVFLIYIWCERRKWFYFICMFVVVVLSGLITMLILNSDLLATYPIFSWLLEPIQLIKNKDFTSLSVLGGASGSRFEIWSAAFNMIKAFPLMGVGQGNFYHLSADIAFSKSHFLALNGGENAHNYFLQTFAELGIVGLIAFVLVFAFPFIKIKDRTLLLPAGLGIFALLLGNVYSHSFLVRENLLLCSTLLGLMYFLASKHASLNSSGHAPINRIGARNILLAIAVFVLGFASVNEIYRSFYNKIFEIGVNCFKVRQLTNDGWTSGVYELEIPRMKSGIEFNAVRPQSRLRGGDVELRVDLLLFEGSGGLSKTYYLTNGEIKKINLALPNNQMPSSMGVKILMRTSNCFTPRNLGINEDSRRLGFHISNLAIF